ncbi:enterotoxin A family protein [Luteibacter sp. CQ10]|uniref:enterotoxin A family protein n=1 Tax=Luteibacter sp. CQ10 TaxID=2805821 RepID=UPI0034A3B532
MTIPGTVFAGRVIALLLLIVISTPSQASFFYRMDTRPPEEVFQRGFSPSGSHPSLFQHVVGQTCQPGRQTSGFIAVSANETFAVDWGRETQPEGARFYVYRIRASEFFYNAAQSLFHASRQTDDLAYELAGWIFMAESEWVTPVGIPAEDIVGAAEYVSRGRDRPPGRMGVYIPAGARESPGTINHAPLTWNYTLDQTEAPPTYNPLCPSVCFGVNHSRHKRSIVAWMEDDDGADEARTKSNHFMRCAVETASAALGIDLPHTDQRATGGGRTEL